MNAVVEGIPIVSLEWMITCLKQKHYVDIKEFAKFNNSKELVRILFNDLSFDFMRVNKKEFSDKF